MAKKKSFDDDFMGNNPFKLMNEVMKEMFSGSLFKEFESNKSNVQRVRVSIGPNGKATVQRSNNVRPKKTFEPWVDVINHEKKITIVIELPGVNKEEVHLNAEKDELTIEVSNPAHSLKKTIKLPEEVKSNSAQATLKNGLLEVILEKKVAKKPVKKKGIKIS